MSRLFPTITYRVETELNISKVKLFLIIKENVCGTIHVSSHFIRDMDWCYIIFVLIKVL